VPYSADGALSSDDKLCRADLLVDARYGEIVAVLEAGTGPGAHVGPDDTVHVMDCHGHILSPGFIDIQINGGYGVDFSDPNITKHDVALVAAKLPVSGVTSFSPTLISCSSDEYSKILPVIGSLCERSDTEMGKVNDVSGACILGIHVEGPFFAPSKSGAHPRQHIQDPIDGINTVYNVYGTNRLCDEFKVTTVTLAPEREGALGAIKALTEQGIVVSMGHTDATLEEGRLAIRNGATLITHLFNAMKPFHHREPALLGLLAESGTCGRQENHLYFTIISDGIHVHSTAIRLAQTLHPTGAVLITDAMSAMGLEDGRHTLGDTDVIVRGMKATVVGTETLAGSVASMDYCVRSYKQFTKCSLVEALRAVTLNPATVLGKSKKGRLVRGADADLVMLDDDLNVLGTWVRGRQLYKALL